METPPQRISVDVKGKGLAAGVRAAFRSLYEAVQILQNGKVILPLLFYFVIKILFIISFIESGTGGLHDFWSLLLPGRQAAGLEHYPHHVMLLPVAMERLSIFLDIFLHIIAQGMTIMLVASALEGKETHLRPSLRRTVKRYWHLVIVMIVALGAMLIVANLPYLVPIPLESLPHRHIPTAVSILLALAVQSFFLYAVPIVLLSRRGGFGALGDSIRFAFRNYPASLTLALAAFAVSLPTFLLGFKSQVIALRLFPELLIHIQVTAELLQFVSTYLLVGGVTVLFLKKTAAPAAEI
jgi:hypothetical protein